MSKNIIDILNESFPHSKFELLQSKFGGMVYSLFVLTNKGEKIESTWEDIRNKTGIYFQNKLHSEFERWNLYLFFLTPDSVDKDLKHKIEHDTISSRKIVIDNYQQDLNNHEQQNLFKKHIALEGSFDAPGNIKHKLKKDSIIFNALCQITPPTKKSEQSKYLDSVISEIEKTLKNEV